MPRTRTAATALLLALALTGSLAPARAALKVPANQAVAACDETVGSVPEAGRRACRSGQSIVWGTAAACRQTPAPREQCGAVDGRVVSEERVAAYEQSWTHRALRLQRALDDGAPLLEALVPHTHNSFNASIYPPTLTNQDPNQVYAIGDQLRMDMRGIELDVHWAPSPYGSPETGGKAAVLCHGQGVAAGPAVVHVGCTVDRPLAAGLAEVRAWLDQPANAGEVLLLYLENNLDGDPVAHDLVARDLETHLGALVLRTPAGEPCAEMPLDSSRAAIRAGGARVLIVGNCGPGGWGAWVHERGPRWNESSSGPGDDYPDFAGCEARRAAEGYGSNWIRHWDDSTWLTAMVGEPREITVTETGRMVRCGVNMPGFDQLVPEDPRLAALVWSWAQDEPAPAADGQCAFQGGDARFHAGDCGQARPFACGDASGGWHVTGAAGAWSSGAAACAAEFPGTSFGVPPNGYRNERLRAAKPAAATEVWLAYRQNPSGDWTLTGS